MNNLPKFMGIGLMVLATGVASAVSLDDCTKDGDTITIPGVDESFPKYEGWIPWLKPYSDGHDWGTDQKAVIWQNKKLSDVKAMRCKMSGSWFGGAERDGRALITKRTDSAMEVQFQCQDGSACKVVLAHLEQVGDDIVIWGQQAGYSETVKIGSPIPGFWLQVSSTPNNGAYGVYGIEVLNVLEATPTELKEYAATVGESGTDTLQINEGTLAIKPTQTNDVFDLNVTGNANVYFEKGVGEFAVETLTGGILTSDAQTLLPGYRLADVMEIVSAISGGGNIGFDPMYIYHLTKTDGKWTFQAQQVSDGWTKVVMVELADAKDGITGKILWRRYKEAWARPLGSDFSTGDYNVNSAYSLSSLVLKVSPSIVFSSSKSSWTTWGTTFNGGMVRISNKPLAANPLTFVANSCVLRLEASGGQWWGGDSRSYTVFRGAELLLATGLAMGSGATLTLDGGTLWMFDGFNYVNDLVITNGGGIVGSTTCRAGYEKDVTWNIYGPDPVTIEPGIELVNNGGKVITLNTQVDTAVSGSLKDAGGYAGATFAKDGAATLTLESENYNAGPFKVVAGELIFANAKGIKSNNAVILGGGVCWASRRVMTVFRLVR